MIKKELISPLNLTGPIARASGSSSDTRLDRPYGAYRNFTPEHCLRKKGDVFSRFEIKASEIRAAVGLILRLTEKLRRVPYLLRTAEVEKVLRDKHFRNYRIFPSW